MSLISIMLTLVVIGVLLGLINRYIPMAASIKAILNIVVVACTVYWVLSAFGLTQSISNVIHGLLDLLPPMNTPTHSEVKS